ncbi:reverse transcriptase domain-containing protein [Tanacetum coccineum]
MPITRQGMSSAAIEQLIAQRVADAIAAYEANRNSRNGTQNKAIGSAGGVEHTARGCLYKEFLNCQPRNFNGTKGVVGLTRLDAAYETTWEELKKMMTKEYCPRNEVQKMESDLWNFSVEGTDIVGYTRRFQELALLYPGMLIKIQEAIRMAHDLRDQAVIAKAIKDADNKRKWEDE